MERVCRAGVAGAGVFGGHHARKYASIEGVELIGVYDRGTGRALALAETLGVNGFEEDAWAAFVDGLDLLTVAAPAVAHADLAVRGLKAGCHVYVEKPLAATREDARAILQAAAEAGRILACGHQERAVFKAMGLLDAPERPIRLEAVRKNSHTGRNEDVSVVLDLMIHDLDLALTLAGDHAQQVTATARAPIGPHADEARAEIVFGGGLTAVFESSRVAEARERTMRVVYPSGEVWIDFLARTFENTTPFALDPGFAESAIGKDPLGYSVQAFVDAARGRAVRPLVTGEEAYAALDLALRVEEASV